MLWNTSLEQLRIMEDTAAKLSIQMTIDQKNSAAIRDIYSRVGFQISRRRVSSG